MMNKPSFFLETLMPISISNSGDKIDSLIWIVGVGFLLQG